MIERDIFIAAIQKDNATERAAYLQEACGTDIALRERLEGLLRAHDNAGGFLEFRYQHRRSTSKENTTRQSKS